LNAPPEMAKELSMLAIIMFTFFCIQIIMKTISTILIADQKPAKAAFFDMLGQLIALVIIFILTKTTSGSLLYLGVVYSMTPIAVLTISTFWFFNGRYKDISPSFKFVEFRYAKDLMSLGLKFFIIQIAGIIIFQTSNIIISNTSQPADVTVFNIAYKYFGIITMVFAILLTPYWSAFTDAKAKNEYSWMQNSYSQLRKFWEISTVLIILMLIVSPFIYKIWIGKVITIPFYVSLFMAFNVIIMIWNTLHSQLLNGLGKIKLQLYFSIFGLIINIPLSLFLGKKFGIIGVVGSSIIINSLVAIFQPIQIKMLLNNKAYGVWNK